MLNDLRLALRGLRRNAGFASIAIITLALGIGASTAIFSVVNGVLLRSLPYPSPDRVMQIQSVNQRGGAVRVSYPDFEDMRGQTQAFEELAAYADWTTSAAAAGQGFRVAWDRSRRASFRCSVWGRLSGGHLARTSIGQANAWPSSVSSNPRRCADGNRGT